MIKKLLSGVLVVLILSPASSSSFSPTHRGIGRGHSSSFGLPLERALISPGALLREQSLWPGSRFTESDRVRAVVRGLKFIYRTALDEKNFAAYGPDYLWCFYTLSTAVKDPGVRRLARRMGLERARLWRGEHRWVPSEADAPTIADLAFGNDAADSLGLHDETLKNQLRREAKYYKARDYLLFDPLTEPPPTDVADECKRCGAYNGRGSKVCFVCKSPLSMRSPQDVWYDALIISYVGDRSGITLGAHYADVLKWLPSFRPYRSIQESGDDQFYDTVYAITHVVYTLNNYNQYKLSPRLLPQEFAFLKANLKEAIAQNDDDMLGEMMDTLRAFGLTSNDPLIRSGMEFYLSHQNADGSWGDTHEKDIYLRYHPTWNAVAGLSEYLWQKEGLSFPELKPLLEKWAAEPKAAAQFGSGKETLNLHHLKVGKAAKRARPRRRLQSATMSVVFNVRHAYR